MWDGMASHDAIIDPSGEQARHDDLAMDSPPCPLSRLKSLCRRTQTKGRQTSPTSPHRRRPASQPRLPRSSTRLADHTTPAARSRRSQVMHAVGFLKFPRQVATQSGPQDHERPIFLVEANNPKMHRAVELAPFDMGGAVLTIIANTSAYLS